MKPFGRGFQAIQMEDGGIEVTYVEHSSYVFASPTTVRRAFNTWNEAVNFLKLWETLDHVQWWEEQRIITPLKQD